MEVFLHTLELDHHHIQQSLPLNSSFGPFDLGSDVYLVYILLVVSH